MIYQMAGKFRENDTLNGANNFCTCVCVRLYVCTYVIRQQKCDES